MPCLLCLRNLQMRSLTVYRDTAPTKIHILGYVGTVAGPHDCAAGNRDQLLISLACTVQRDNLATNWDTHPSLSRMMSSKRLYTSGGGCSRDTRVVRWR